MFAQKSTSTKEHAAPTKAEWRALEHQFYQHMPATAQAFQEARLSPLEWHVCILTLLDFEVWAIVNLTKSSNQAITTAKSRSNQKLFMEKGAPTLREHLLQLAGVR